jgi:hypothetical protein
MVIAQQCAQAVTSRVRLSRISFCISDAEMPRIAASSLAVMETSRGRIARPSTWMKGPSVSLGRRAIVPGELLAVDARQRAQYVGLGRGEKRQLEGERQDEPPGFASFSMLRLFRLLRLRPDLHSLAMSNAAATQRRALKVPSAEASRDAGAAVQALERTLRKKSAKVDLRTRSTKPESVRVPREAFELFMEILAQMANGNAVTVVPVHAEVTTQEVRPRHVEHVGRPPLYIGDVIHKAMIGLDEKGVEAAAATAVSMVGLGIPSDKKVFHADRPFFFAIIDEPTQSVLFVGHVVDPTK